MAHGWRSVHWWGECEEADEGMRIGRVVQDGGWRERDQGRFATLVVLEARR